jgi:hypothetical protein
MHEAVQALIDQTHGRLELDRVKNDPWRPEATTLRPAEKEAQLLGSRDRDT